MGSLPRAIVFMKIGFRSGETLDRIMERKIKEELTAGAAFWGYWYRLTMALFQHA